MTNQPITRIGPFNLNEKHMRDIINSGTIPIRKLEINLDVTNEELLKPYMIERKLVDEFPKEWIEFQNGNFMPLNKIKELKNESYTGNVLNYFTNLVEKDKEEIYPYLKDIFDANRGILNLAQPGRIRRLQADIENKKLILLNHIL
ncbi:MAG: hypothetical protein WC812_01205 [Candidatus Pacearchaeota archaeon]|jgi:hypothetical protein